MASPQTFIFAVYDGTTGAPKTGLASSLAFDAYLTDIGTVAITPNFREVGGGLYAFDPSFPTGRGIAFCINTHSNNPARLSGYIRPDEFITTAAASPNIVVFPIYDATTGLLKPGQSPVFTTYCDDTGAPLSSPAITEIGFSGLYKFTPTFNANRDTCYVINTGGAGASTPLNVSGFVRVEDFPPTPATSSLVGPDVVITPSASSVDFGSDTYCVTGLPLVSVPVTGTQLVGQRIIKRLSTPRGALAVIGGDPGAGWDLRQLVNAKLSPNQITQYQAQIQAECVKDEAVEQARATLTFSAATGKLAVSLLLTTSVGPFTLVLGVDALTVTLLDTF